jgi:hypothetical protein
VAADAGISKLLLMHLPPFAPGLDELLIEAQAVVADTALADDGADVSRLLHWAGVRRGPASPVRGRS